MGKAFFFSICFFFFVACTNSEADKTKEPEVANPSVSENSSTAIETALPDVFHYFGRQDTSFSATNFQLAFEDSIEALPPGTLNKEELKPYFPYFIYNRDSSQAIDMYSYNILLSNKNGSIVGEAAGPDSEVALLDFKANTRRRLLFGGPSLAVLDAAWLNDKIILIAGAEIVNDEQLKPIIWKIDPVNHKRETFFYSDTLTASVLQYEDKRIHIR
ncbi:MAG: hypothetical protein ICV53_09425 [Flavisolibacter sp.]|nr:hypothetical protein [Flavisolibacter sp.]